MQLQCINTANLQEKYKDTKCICFPQLAQKADTGAQTYNTNSYQYMYIRVKRQAKL